MCMLPNLGTIWLTTQFTCFTWMNMVASDDVHYVAVATRENVCNVQLIDSLWTGTISWVHWKDKEKFACLAGREMQYPNDKEA